MANCYVQGCQEPVIGQVPDASGNMICQKHHDEAFPKPTPAVEETNAEARAEQQAMDEPPLIELSDDTSASGSGKKSKK